MKQTTKEQEKKNPVLRIAQPEALESMPRSDQPGGLI